MSLKETINQKFIEAFKTRDAIKKFPYEIMKQRIMVAEKSGQYEEPLTDEQIVNLIAKEIKERTELMSIYSPGDFEYEAAAHTVKELSQYLPAQLTEDEVLGIIMRIMLTESNKGKIIGLTVKEVGNRFDKARIATLVKSI
jgi:uncharacterized protein YqeY